MSLNIERVTEQHGGSGSIEAVALLPKGSGGVEKILLRLDSLAGDEIPELDGHGPAFMVERADEDGTVALWFACVKQGQNAGYGVGPAGELYLNWDGGTRLTLAPGQWNLVQAMGSASDL